MATKIKALQQWCKHRTDGYRDVEIKDFTTSWRSGMAFCALIHRFRPDLIDYDSLSKENVFENNHLAFTVAEQELDIPAFLEAADMVALKTPDKLSVITYVSQYYNKLHALPQLGGPGVREKTASAATAGVKRHQKAEPLSEPEPKKQASVIQAKESNNNREKGKSLGDKCAICNNRVYLLERHIEEGQLYHRSCFRHSDLSPTNKVYTRSPFLSPSLHGKEQENNHSAVSSGIISSLDKVKDVSKTYSVESKQGLKRPSDDVKSDEPSKKSEIQKSLLSDLDKAAVKMLDNKKSETKHSDIGKSDLSKVSQQPSKLETLNTDDCLSQTSKFNARTFEKHNLDFLFGEKDPKDAKISKRQLPLIFQANSSSGNGDLDKNKSRSKENLLLSSGNKDVSVPQISLPSASKSKSENQSKSVLSGNKTDIQNQSKSVLTGNKTDTGNQSKSVLFGNKTDTGNQSKSVLFGNKTDTQNQSKSVLTGNKTDTGNQSKSVLSGNKTDTENKSKSVLSGNKTDNQSKSSAAAQSKIENNEKAMGPTAKPRNVGKKVCDEKMDTSEPGQPNAKSPSFPRPTPRNSLFSKEADQKPMGKETYSPSILRSTASKPGSAIRNKSPEPPQLPSSEPPSLPVSAPPSVIFSQDLLTVKNKSREGQLHKTAAEPSSEAHKEQDRFSSISSALSASKNRDKHTFYKPPSLTPVSGVKTSTTNSTATLKPSSLSSVSNISKISTSTSGTCTTAITSGSSVSSTLNTKSTISFQSNKCRDEPMDIDTAVSRAQAKYGEEPVAVTVANKDHQEQVALSGLLRSLAQVRNTSSSTSTSTSTVTSVTTNTSDKANSKVIASASEPKSASSGFVKAKIGRLQGTGNDHKTTSHIASPRDVHLSQVTTPSSYKSDHVDGLNSKRNIAEQNKYDTQSHDASAKMPDKKPAGAVSVMLNTGNRGRETPNKPKLEHLQNTKSSNVFPQMVSESSVTAENRSINTNSKSVLADIPGKRDRPRSTADILSVNTSSSSKPDNAIPDAVPPPPPFMQVKLREPSNSVENRQERSKSVGHLLEDKAESKPEWQLEAERRKALLKGTGFIDPETKKVNSSNKTSQEEDEASKKEDSVQPSATREKNWQETNTFNSYQKSKAKGEETVETPPKKPERLIKEKQSASDTTPAAVAVARTPREHLSQNSLQTKECAETSKKKITVDNIKEADTLRTSSELSVLIKLKKIAVDSTFDFNSSNSAKSPAKSTDRPAAVKLTPPARPPPPRQVKLSPPKLSAIELQQQLLDIDSKLSDLELKGRHLEETIRSVAAEEEDDIMKEWFQLVNEKNQLVRRETDLVYMSREQELESEQSRLDSQLQYLVSKDESEKSFEEIQEEDYLIQRKLDIVNQRNSIVESMDEDRLRYEEEDRDIAQKLQDKGFLKNGNNPTGIERSKVTDKGTPGKKEKVMGSSKFYA